MGCVCDVPAAVPAIEEPRRERIVRRSSLHVQVHTSTSRSSAFARTIRITKYCGRRRPVSCGDPPTRPAASNVSEPYAPVHTTPVSLQALAGRQRN